MSKTVVTIPTGAAITHFNTVDGKNLVLHFDNLENYKGPMNPYFGASIGRYANRIYGKEIEVAGKKWELKPNKEYDVTLHGGAKGWNLLEWEGPETKTVDGKDVFVYKLNSPHLDQGFPGSVNATATYTSYTKVDPADGIEKVYLELEYEAELAEDSPVDETIISLTNHSHFNLSKDQVTNAGTQIKISTNQYIVHDEKTTIPTGEISSHPAVPADQSFITLGPIEPIIDHAFVPQPLENEFKGLDTRKYRDVQTHAHIFNPETKINLTIGSTEPTFQVYTGLFMDLPILEGESRSFEPGSCIAVEPARPTNAAKYPDWREWVSLKKGDKYGSKIVYTNWISK